MAEGEEVRLMRAPPRDHDSEEMQRDYEGMRLRLRLAAGALFTVVSAWALREVAFAGRPAALAPQDGAPRAMSHLHGGQPARPGVRVDMLDDTHRQDAAADLHDEKYDRLRTWVLRNGGKIRGVEGRAAFAGGGRGLYATKALEKGEEIVVIPRQLWLSERNAYVSSPLGYVFATDHKLSTFLKDNAFENWALILMIEAEKHNEYSFFKPYLDFLPLPASTIRYTGEEVDQFGSDTLKANVERNRKRVRDVFDDIMVHLISTYPTMFDAHNNTYESLLATTVTCWSRTFNGNLVPISDLLNHVTGSPGAGNYHTHLNHPDGPVSGARDKRGFKDEKGWTCREWDGYDCFAATSSEGLSKKGQADLISNCPKTCGVCAGNVNVEKVKEAANMEAFTLRAPQPKRSGQEVVISYGDSRSTMSWLLWAGFVPDESRYGDYYTLEAHGHVTFVDAHGAVDEAFLGKVGKAMSGGEDPDVAAAVQFVSAGLHNASIRFSAVSSLAHDKAELANPATLFKRHVILQGRVRIKEMLVATEEALAHTADRLSQGKELDQGAGGKAAGRHKRKSLVSHKFATGSSRWKKEETRRKNALLTVRLGAH